MFTLKPYPAFLALVVLLVFARPALAFGAGNIASISKVEGQNWRHGDIEDTLLSLLMARAVGGKKFDKLAVSRVYFGNWLRDYSQAIDVGTVKSVSAEAIRLLLCILGFMSFGFGSKEFEVTADRLGCYRPEDHIDNPKNYADNVDARQYDRRLRGPIDEGVELAVDEETGMKNYIANERVDIMTSALHVRRLFSRCIELGRNYQRNQNKADFHEALRLMGTGLHCLEDFLAHSNYTELALIEMGERDIFPHVGRDTRMRLQGAREEVYPLVTGTFGGVDFLHSVTGEVSDKLTQNEIDELEGVLQNNSRNDTSIIEGLLDKIPDGMFGDTGDKKQKMGEIQQNAQSAQMENMSVSPREPEEYTRYVQQVFQQIMPAIEFHDDLMKGISEAIEKIPVLPKIVEQLEEQMSVWVFSIMAPFVVPVIQQVKNELRTGSSEIIESSKNEQHIVFNDDNCTDPTHSMLSKDHFSNILNEAAGKTASKVVAWVVPQLMEAWDDDGVDVDRLMNRIIYGVMHHPAQRDMGEDGAQDGRNIMFRSIEEWWRQMDDGEKDEYRRKLSRDGVENGENHKEGVADSGHGCGGHLGMHKNFAKGGTMEDRIAGAAADAIVGGITGSISDIVQSQTGVHLPSTEGGYGGRQEQSSEGGGGGGGLGGFLSSVGGSLLSGAFKDENKTSYSESRQDNKSYTESRTEYGHSGNRYEQAEVTETQYSSGRETRDYQRYEQDEDSRGNTRGYGYEERTEEYGGGRREEGGYGGGREEYGGGRREEGGYGGGREEYGGGRREEGGYGGGREEYGGGRRDDEGGYGGGREDRREDRGGGDFLGGILDSVDRANDGERRGGGWGF
ncbi:heterokaryon incompatibility protein Het-C-domain-containing protein [Pseudomassariella vexata]|uniref:Heterokaryon incompatibility protein Het-C-domain-containing protein n=1 Tax=Pseudomassariella vexata TaxID=1141098 RepID=A0A1Y2DEW5_9PEZI|nr:heterokaryon incompatibility protein Het-C-domain-containing protein [Pseudomassariella vexata]ORY57205.1 heterokaryon incompatibility protein Het-C-domain-containing protein [Pseudomassariella vexata]